MKDSNDAQTVDWVDESNERNTKKAADTCPQANPNLLIAPPVNAALHAALSTMIDRTLTDILNNKEQ